jgi:hypothetical protein
MLETEKGTHRYGWPARRDDPQLEFQVGEWLAAIRGLLPEEAAGQEAGS